MKPASRRQWRLAPAGWMCLALAAALPAAQAQTAKWPEKAVRIIVAAGTGGGSDYTTRLIAPKFGDILGQPFIVENRPGAGGLIGQTLVQKSPPDGYTLLLAEGSMAGARFVNAAVPYDVLRDFTPISLLETSQFIMLVHPAMPARNTREYVALARARPGRMTYATLGRGQIPYWGAVLFNRMAGIKAVEVPYKGISEAVVDVITGRVDYFFAPTATAVANKSRVRPLAVTGTRRSPAFPEVPTLAEAALPGYDLPVWRSIMGPAGMRREVVATLNAAIVRTLGMPDIRERLLFVGSEARPSTPEELAGRYADWAKRFARIAKQAGIKPL